MSDTLFVDLLASFVPRLIQKRAVENPTPIETPFSDELYAVVLFADISGFTALTEKLAQRGPVGVETLAHILNDYFGKLIDIVHNHGGDVMKFAGDALLVIWPLASTSGMTDSASKEAQRQLTLRAAECALEIRSKFLNYKTDEGTLYLKLTLASGSLIETHVGGVFNRWEFALTGSPLVELGAANNLAKAGDILLSPSSLALIKNDCHIEKVEFTLNGETNPAARLIKLQNTSQVPAAKERITLTEHEQPALNPYIPGSIINRIAVGQSEWLAELRTVTIVFINVLDPAQVSSVDVSQELMRAIQRTTYRFEGSVNKISQDDKGVMIDVAFGLPPLSHEDDPLRAIQAAMLIRDELRKMNIQSSIGITTGRVFCGLVGNSDRRVYTFLGNSVNMAARLMTLGISQSDIMARQGIAVLCDRATYEGAKEQVEFETLAPQKIKGRSEAVEVFHPLRGKATVMRQQTQLIGRLAEKAVLVNALLELQRGSRLQTVILQGEAGIGKSQLTNDLVRQIQDSEIHFLMGEGDSIEKSYPGLQASIQDRKTYNYAAFGGWCG